MKLCDGLEIGFEDYRTPGAFNRQAEKVERQGIERFNHEEKSLAATVTRKFKELWQRPDTESLPPRSCRCKRFRNSPRALWRRC